MTDQQRPHLELVRPPEPKVCELLARIEHLERDLRDMGYRVARMESMFPRGVRRGT